MDVVPMPGLVLRCEITFLQVKEEALVFTEAVPHLANNHATEKKTSLCDWPAVIGQQTSGAAATLLSESMEAIMWVEEFRACF